MPGKLTEEEERRVQASLEGLPKVRKAWCLDLLGYLGQFIWAGQPAKWTSDDTETLAMNCWCAPIYIALKTGRLRLKTCNDFDLLPFQYQPALSPLHASQRAAFEFLKGSLAMPRDEGMPGDLILFCIKNLDNFSGGSDKIPQSQVEYNKTVPFDKCPVHCAVNMGANECVSLWETPNDYNKYQLCKISELALAIERERKTTCTYSSITPFWITQAQNKPKCYITTATCQAKQLPDDCRELTTLRWFRDTVVSQTSTGRDQIAKYYETAPQIVAAINRRPDSAQIYDQLFQEYIQPSIAAVGRGEYENAYSLFENMVTELQKRHGDE